MVTHCGNRNRSVGTDYNVFLWSYSCCTRQKIYGVLLCGRYFSHERTSKGYFCFVHITLGVTVMVEPHQGKIKRGSDVNLFGS